MTETELQAQAPQEPLPEQLVLLLSEHMDIGVPPESLTPRTTFESLGMDSLRLMELVVAAEQEFGTVLPDTAVDRLSASSTLADAAHVFSDAADVEANPDAR